VRGIREEGKGCLLSCRFSSLAGFLRGGGKARRTQRDTWMVTYAYFWGAFFYLEYLERELDTSPFSLPVTYPTARIPFPISPPLSPIYCSSIHPSSLIPQHRHHATATTPNKDLSTG